MSENNEKIITSRSLHEEFNEERKKNGLVELPAINCRKGSTGTYARKDKSFSSAFDFYKKLVRRSKENKK